MPHYPFPYCVVSRSLMNGTDVSYDGHLSLQTTNAVSTHIDKNPSISSITTDATSSSLLSAFNAEIASVQSSAAPLFYAQASSIVISRRGSFESMAIIRPPGSEALGSGPSTAYFTTLPPSLSWSPPSPFGCEFSSAFTSCNVGPDVDGETFDNWRSSYYSTGFPPDFEVHSAAFKEFSEKTSRAWVAGASGIVRRPRARKEKRGMRRPGHGGSGKRGGGGGSVGGREKKSGSKLRSAWHE